jgi:glycosyltransferase involved in cell wall biosynthesis
VTPSQSLKVLIQQSYQFRHNEVGILRNSFGDGLIRQEKPSHSSSQNHYFLSLGRLQASKGYLSLIQAFEALPDIPLYIAGSGPYRTEMEAYIKSGNLSHIHLLPWKSGLELAELFQNALAVIIPSLSYENLGMVILEAFSFSKAVIGTQVGGIPELVHHGETGLLYPPGDVTSLRQCVKELWDNPALAEQLGMNGFSFVTRTYSSESLYQEMMAAFDKTIRLHQTRREPRLP